MCQAGSQQYEIIAERKCGGRDVISAVSVAFTDSGRSLSRKVENICRARADREILWKDQTKIDEETFRNADVLFFFCACGIAVRKIAPFLADKTSDPAVLVIGENGKDVISLLSGHLGGANRWTGEVADALGARPIITTATDGRKMPSIDLWALKCRLSIGDMVQAKRFTAYLLKTARQNGDESFVFGSPEKDKEGKGKEEENRAGAQGRKGQKKNGAKRAEDGSPWAICITEEPRLSCGEDTLILRPKRFVLGVGCRRGTDAAKMRKFIFDFLEENEINPRLVERICSIDRKKDEDCIKAAARELKVPFTVFSAEELTAVLGSFSGSDFVKQTVGVDNVCERAAVCGAGAESRLIVKKTVADGMTAAAALRSSLLNGTVILTPEEWLKIASEQSEGDEV